MCAGAGSSARARDIRRARFTAPGELRSRLLLVLLFQLAVAGLVGQALLLSAVCFLGLVLVVEEDGACK